MQYYFFPTDFYYPKPPSSIKAAGTTDHQRGVVPFKPPVDVSDSGADAADQNSPSFKIVKVRTTADKRLRTQNLASKNNVIYK